MENLKMEIPVTFLTILFIRPLRAFAVSLECIQSDQMPVLRLLQMQIAAITGALLTEMETMENSY
jgi:hypothetical protein